ncbi:MAG TPA: endonuclease/exonuclease/phosphatase family protein [Isosphaeraceae bacterium]|nr:endonuclease/exonuclease/phosphatase family protein [Isosphaeraceae bacterium]
MASSEKPTEFWRCGRCGTPNPLTSYLAQCVACGASRGEGTMLASKAPAPKPTAPAKSPSLWLRVLSLAYLTWLMVILVVMRTLGDLWAPATILLFLPRFLWAAPLPLLGWWTWRRRDRWIALAQVVSLLLVLGPIMNFRLPLGRFFRDALPPDRLRVLSLNQSTNPIDLDAVKKLMEQERIDVVCFQEGPIQSGAPDPRLVKILTTLGWSFTSTQRIASRLPILSESHYKKDPYPEYGFWAVRIHQVKVRTRSGRAVWVADIHMPTVRIGFQRLLEGDLGALGRLNQWRQKQVEVLLAQTLGHSDDPIVIAGDFNTPPESRLLDPLRDLGQFGFDEVGLGYGYTRPSSLAFVAIDHIVATPQWVFTRCEVGPDVGSDHLPVIAELALPAPSKKARSAESEPGA